MSTIDELTPKQRAFVLAYLSPDVAFNATEATRRAGYKGNDDTMRAVASENLRKPRIARAITEELHKARRGSAVTIESVLDNLERIAAKAEASGAYQAAVRATELQGKYLKMFVDRIEHSRAIGDISDEELRGLLVELAGKGVLAGLVDSLAAAGEPRRAQATSEAESTD